MTACEKLLIAILKRKDSKLLSLIQKRWLDVTEVKEYVYVMDYYRETGEIMGVKTFCSKFHLDSSEADSRPVAYLNELKERFVMTQLAEQVPSILRGVKDDPKESLSKLQTLVGSLSTDSIESKDSLYSDDTKDRYEEYLERIEKKGVTYLSMGSDDMDSVFYGYRREDLITIGGKAGSGKTWLMVYLAYLLEKVIAEKESEGETLGDILFITNEMASAEIIERFDCIRFRLPYKSFLEGSLTERESKRYEKGLEVLSKSRSKIRIVDGCQTIDELTTLMGLYQPSAVFIDGSYLMEGRMPEGWEKIVYITRNLKRMSKNFKVPIINTTQLKRGSSKGASKIASDGQDEFAYSTSYAQDSDIAIRMFQDADMKFHDLVGCEVVKGRRVIGGTVLIFQNDLLKMSHSMTLPAEPAAKKVELSELD